MRQRGVIVAPAWQGCCIAERLGVAVVRQARTENPGPTRAMTAKTMPNRAGPTGASAWPLRRSNALRAPIRALGGAPSAARRSTREVVGGNTTRELVVGRLEPDHMEGDHRAIGHRRRTNSIVGRRCLPARSRRAPGPRCPAGARSPIEG